MTKVYGHLKTPDGSIADKASIRFILTSPGANDQTLYIQNSSVTAYADANGYFELNIWPNLSSSVIAPYEIIIFSGTEITDYWEGYIPKDTESISIDELYTLSKGVKGLPVEFTFINNAVEKVDKIVSQAASVTTIKGNAEAALVRANNAIENANNAIIRANTAAATGLEVKFVPNGNLTQRIGSGFWQFPESSKANGWPRDYSWSHLITSTHDNPNNYYSLQISAPFFGQSEYYIRNTDNIGNKPWDRILTENSTILKYTKIEGFKWYKAFKINNGNDFQAANEATNVVFRILGQTDFGRTANVQTAVIEGSFGVRGSAIRPVLTSKGDLTFGDEAAAFQFRIYAEPRPGGGEDAYLYIRTPTYSTAVVEHFDIYSVPIFEITGVITESNGNWNIPTPSTGRLMWDSANPTNGVQDIFVGNNKVYHKGDFDINSILARLAALEAK